MNRHELMSLTLKGLLAWLQKRPNGRVNLAACTHIHPSNLQVLMATDAVISAWPSDAGLAIWLQSALPTRADDTVAGHQ